MKQMLGEPVDWADPINKGLVLYLRMNENMGDHLHDLSLNDNHGTIHNMAHPGTPASGWTPGPEGKLLAFDGDDDYVNCGNNPSIHLTDDVTISMWWKPVSWTNASNIIAFSTTGETQDDNAAYLIAQYSDGDLIVGHEYDAGVNQYTLFDTNLTLGEWVHIIAVRDATALTWDLYLNGKKFGSSYNYAANANGGINSSFDLCVAFSPPGYYTHCHLNDVRIYNRALSANEVNHLYIAGNPTTSGVAQIPRYFVFDVATTGAAETFALPLEVGGDYNFNVNWGDGGQDTITAHDDAAVTHEYASAGTHTITIEGTIEGWRFNNAGDCAKMRDIKSWGCLRLGNNNAYFRGCAGLTVSATDALNLTGTTTLRSIFNGCIALTAVDVSSWDISSVTSLFAAFYNCNSLTSLDVSLWDISTVNNMYAAFYGCTALTSLDVSSWNTGSVTDMDYVFYDCALLTTVDTSSWDITAMTTADLMFDGVTLSTLTYDALLVGWEAQAENSNVTFGVGSSKFSAGAAATAKAALQSNGWVITDGGQV